MIASLIIAQTLIPMLTARFPSPPAMRGRSWIARLQARYASALTWSLHAPPRHRTERSSAYCVLTAGLIAASAAFPDKLLEVAMFTQDAGRQVVLDYGIRGTHPIERVEAAVNKVEGFFRAQREELGIERLYTVYAAEDAHSVIMLREGGMKHARFRRRCSKASCPRSSSASRPSSSTTTAARSRAASACSSRAKPQSASPRWPTTWCACCAACPASAPCAPKRAQGDEEVQITVDRARTAALGLDRSRWQWP